LIMGKQKNIPALRFPEFEGEWEVKSLIELSENGFSNGAFNDPRKVGKGYRIINVKDMYLGDSIDVEKLTLIDLDEKEFLKNRVEYGDIFFTRSSLVKEGIAHSNVNLSKAEDLTYDGHLIRMRPNKKLSSPLFLAYNFTTSMIRTQFIKRGKTTTMTTIGQEDIATVQVKLPSLPEQTKIASFLSSIDDRLQSLKKKKALLEQYKKGMMQKIFSQELRFKDDKGKEFPDWDEKMLGECLDYIQPTKYLVSSTEYDDSYSTPVLTAGKTFILGYTNETDGIYEHNLPIIIFDDFTTATQFVDFPFKAKSSAMKILIANNGINIKFIYEAIQMMKYEIGGHERHWISKFAPMTISVPSIEEQTKIANFLSAIDKKINHCQTQIEKTEQYKKGLLQQMFC
jgi:type I restriction enzyme, S subunit